MDGNNTGFTAELQNALAGAEQLAVEKNSEIIRQEWPKIQQSFSQLVADGEDEMKFSIDVFLTKASYGIGVKANMIYKTVRKASVSEGFARFDGTVQQELPLHGAEGDADGSGTEGDADATPVDLTQTASAFGYVTVGGEPDIDALLAAAKGIFTEACRNSSFLLIKKIGCSLEEAQEIMRELNSRGQLDASLDPAPALTDEQEQDTERDAIAAQADVDAGSAETPSATPWADTPEEAESMLDRAVAVLCASKTPRVSAIQRKLALPLRKAQALFDAATAKMQAREIENANAPADALPPSIIEKTCVDCAKFDACAVAKPNESNVQCDGFVARDGAQ